MAYLVTFALAAVLAGIAGRVAPPVAQRALIARTDTRRRAWQGYLTLLLAIAPILLLSALREGIGTDYYYTYVPRFQDILAGERTHYEIGFYWINRIIAAVTDNPQWVFAVTGVLTGGCLFTMWYKQGADMPFCVLFLLASGEYFISLNNVRQALAAAVLLCGIGLLQRRRFLWFAVLTLIAAALHQGMLVGIAVLALAIAATYIPLEKLILPAALLGGAAVIILWCFPDAVAAVLPYRFAQYIVNDMYRHPTIGVLRTVFNAAVLAFLLVTRYRTRDRALDLYVLIQTVAVAVCLADGALPAAYRVLRLFTCWQLVAIPQAAATYPAPRARRAVQAAILIAYAALTAYAVVLRGDEAVWPYRWIFG